MSSKKLTALLIGLLLLVGGCGFSGGLSDSFQFSKEADSDRQRITFGRVPSETVISLLRDNEPLIEHLEDELDVDIQFVFATDYDQIIDGMVEEKYDFALLGPYAYVLSKEKSDYEAVVRRERFGKDWYRGIIFTKEGRGITSLRDLRGNSFAFVDPSSTSGYLFPKARMIEAGVGKGTDDFHQAFSSTSFLGRHDRVVRAVYRGEFAAGATYKDARTDANLPNATEELPVLAETRKIPTSPIVVSDRFRKNNPKLTAEIIVLLTSLHNTEKGKDVLEALGIDRYIRSEEGDYSEVEKVRETLQGASE